MSTWMAVAILGYMVLVLVGSFVGNMNGMRRGSGGTVGWGIWKRRGRLGDRRVGGMKLPVRVDTVAGCMWYVCDSAMLKDFEVFGVAGFSGSKRDRDRLVREMDRRYVLGEVVGVSSGGRRVGIDYFRVLGRGNGDGGRKTMRPSVLGTRLC